MPKNSKVAELKKNARAGVREAQYELGFRFDCGDGVKEDHQVALKLYRQAATQGHIQAQLALAEDLREESPEEAFQWFVRAAEAGNGEAQLVVAEFYEDGVVVPKNDHIAFDWYLKAASMGNTSAYLPVGRCYVTGIGITKNADEAIRWLRHIVDPGTTVDDVSMSMGQFYLSLVHADPEHQKVDQIEAYVWMNIAAAYAPNGKLYGDASWESLGKCRDTIANKLSKSQLQEAQRRSTDLFVPRHLIQKRLYGNSTSAR